MNLNSLAHLIRDDVTTCVVIFGTNPNKQYLFKISKKLADKLEPNDPVICHTCHGYKTAWIQEIHEESQIDPEDDMDFTWVFQRVAYEVLEGHQEVENEIADKLKARRKLSHRQQALAALGITNPSEFMRELKAPEE